jgi:hypothetical protein
MTVNSMKFLTAISHDLYYYRTAQYVTNPVTSVYKVCMKELVTIYKKGGFNITDIHCDNEFHKVRDLFSAGQTPPIKMNYASAQEHVPRTERNNRVIQERVRAAYHRFPFTHLPRTLVKYLLLWNRQRS